MVWATTGAYVAVCGSDAFALNQSQCDSTATTHAVAGVGFFVGVALMIIGIIPRNRR